MYGADAREQLLACRIFENVALGACLQRTMAVLIPVIGRQDDHPCRWPLLPDEFAEWLGAGAPVRRWATLWGTSTVKLLGKMGGHLQGKPFRKHCCHGAPDNFANSVHGHIASLSCGRLPAQQPRSSWKFRSPVILLQPAERMQNAQRFSFRQQCGFPVGIRSLPHSETAT